MASADLALARELVATATARLEMVMDHLETFDLEEARGKRKRDEKILSTARDAIDLTWSTLDNLLTELRNRVWLAELARLSGGGR